MRDLVTLGFAKKHSRSRKSLARFLKVALAAEWPRFTALKESFPAADYAPATRNKYRIIAIVNFENRAVPIHEVLAHEEYSREDL